MKPQRLTFGRMIPNAGYEAKYRREIRKVIKAMRKDVDRELAQLYKTEVVSDAPATLVTIMAMLRKRWYKIFDKRAKEMTEWMARTVGKRTQKMVLDQLKKINFSVTPQYTGADKRIIKKAVRDATKLIKSIPRTYLKDVQETVQSAYERGGDMKGIIDDITDKINRKAYPNAERRAELIARDQLNKVTQDFALNEAQSVGATKGEWIHVPGEFSSRITHIHMDGQIFDLNVGLYDEDVERYVLPAELPYCNCQFAAVLMGTE